MDLQALSDEDLDTLRVDVQTEQERRRDLATIPGQITDLTARYIAGGGDPTGLPPSPAPPA